MCFNFSNLMLCITHNCNGKCDFCMRGDPQEKNMSYDMIEKIFSETSQIEHLVITGGEPSLYPEGIRWITYCAKKYGCRIGAFFCATNGIEYSEEFIKALDELYCFCTEKAKCELTFSIDQFHKAPNEKARQEYEKVPYYSTSKIQGVIFKKDILSEGRAKQNGLGRYSMPIVRYVFDYSLNGLNINIGDRIFINSCGEVVLDADLSYENQQERKIGNICNESLFEILRRSFYKIPEHWCIDGENSFYKVSIKADDNTILNSAVTESAYYELPQEASVAYQSILRNIRMMPMDETEKFVPDDLELIYEDLPVADKRCAGTKIHYKSSAISGDKTVTVEVIRCPITVGVLYGGK